MYISNNGETFTIILYSTAIISIYFFNIEDSTKFTVMDSPKTNNIFLLIFEIF